MTWTTPRTWVTNELVTADVLNEHVRDNLNALKAPPTASYILGTSYSTTSTTYVNVDSTNLALTITTTGGDVVVGFNGAGVMAVLGNSGYLTVSMDNVNVAGAYGITFLTSSAVVPISFAFLLRDLSPGVHTFRLQWKVSGSTATLYATGEFWVREMS